VNVIELRKVEPSANALASGQSIKAVFANDKSGTLTVRWFVAGILAIALGIASWLLIKDPIFARALAIAGICLALWLTEVVPPYVPTLLLWAMTPLLLSGYGAQFHLSRVRRCRNIGHPHGERSGGCNHKKHQTNLTTTSARLLMR
jgi:hypothetical protein